MPYPRYQAGSLPELRPAFCARARGGGAQGDGRGQPSRAESVRVGLVHGI